MSTLTSAITLTTAERLDRIGAQDVLPGDPHLGGALEAGLLRGRALLAELRATGRPLGS